MNEWRMFIASSVKGHRYAEAIKSVIDAKFGRVVCSLWDLGAFEAGRSFLDSLERLPTKYNCGLAVFTADDPLSNLTMAPRDNVVLEFGLFLGVFGRDRSFLLVENRDDLKIPSDYKGITQNRFYPVADAGSSEDLSNAVSAACVNVVEHLKRQEEKPRAEALERIERHWRERYPGKPFQMFSFLGLTEIAEDEGEECNEECVYYLWADAGAGSWVRARIEPAGKAGESDADEKLRVEYENKAGGFPGNVAIRLNRRCVRSASPKRFTRLRFEARIPADAGQGLAGAADEAYLGLRVVDALTTHWVYCRVPHEYSLLHVIGGGEWREFEVALNGACRWSVFQADGNCLYHDDAPDFSQVLGVVVEVGAKGKGRSGAGVGVVQLKNFQLE